MSSSRSSAAALRRGEQTPKGKDLQSSEVMGYATALCSAPCSAGNSVVSSTGRLSSAGAQQLNWKEGGRVPWI